MSDADDLRAIALRVEARDSSITALHQTVAQRDAAIDELAATLATASSEPWEDDFTGDWKTRWGVGAAPNLKNMLVQADGSLKVTCPAKTAQVMGWHAQPSVAWGDHMRGGYTWRIPAGWRWKNSAGKGGGKLPGWGANRRYPVHSQVGTGGDRWNGLTAVDRAHLHLTDSASLRLIWSASGLLHAYIYAQAPVGPINDSVSYYGATLVGNGAAKPHEGNNVIAWETAMNTPGHADGAVVLTLDGVELVNRDDITWRSTTQPLVHPTQLLGTFQFGGGDAEAPDTATTVGLDEFWLEAA